jgi:hypothetical protein
MVDSQLDSFQRGALGIKFNPLDVPPEEFITAGRAWEMCRSGRADPDKFGIFDMHGIRFIWGDVVRDFLALNKIEILPWDGGWGFLNQRLSDPLPDEETLMLYDKVARMTLAINEKFPEIRANYKSEFPCTPWMGSKGRIACALLIALDLDCDDSGPRIHFSDPFGGGPHLARYSSKLSSAICNLWCEQPKRIPDRKPDSFAQVEASDPSPMLPVFSLPDMRLPYFAGPLRTPRQL